ncbi:MAG: hypothetical protein ACK526_06260 [Planctomyces sp.]
MVHHSVHRSGGLAPADTHMTATCEQRHRPSFRRARPGGRTNDSYMLQAAPAPAPLPKGDHAFRRARPGGRTTDSYK